MIKGIEIGQQSECWSPWKISLTNNKNDKIFRRNWRQILNLNSRRCCRIFIPSELCQWTTQQGRQASLNCKWLQLFSFILAHKIRLTILSQFQPHQKLLILDENQLQRPTACKSKLDSWRLQSQVSLIQAWLHFRVIFHKKKDMSTEFANAL